MFFYSMSLNSDRLLDWGLVAVGTLHLSSRVSLAGGLGCRAAGTTLSVELHQLAQFKFGLLQHLDLPDEHVMEGVDGLACLLDVLANAVRDQLVDHLLQVVGPHLRVMISIIFLRIW